MSVQEDIQVTSAVCIPGEELAVEFSRSSGPGGQHVNKVETRVTLCFNIETSSVLTPEQKTMIREALSSRVNKDGILRVSCEESRSQSVNRELARDRFRDLLKSAIAVRKKRVATKATRASQRKRLDNKRRRGDVKKGRGGNWQGE